MTIVFIALIILSLSGPTLITYYYHRKWMKVWHEHEREVAQLYLDRTATFHVKR